jgi:hypothetical protein
MAEVSSAKRERSQIEWRRNKVQELVVKGYNQYEIGDTLKIGQPTISRDLDSGFSGQPTIATAGSSKPSESYPAKTIRRIPALSNRNESSIEVKLADC